VDAKGITQHLSSWDDTEVVTAGEQVKQLIQTPAWEFIQQSIRDYERVLVGSVVSNPQDSIEKYAHRSGEIKGLRAVEQIAHGLVTQGKAIEDQRRAQEARA
jgi:hypothetical protein